MNSRYLDRGYDLRERTVTYCSGTSTKTNNSGSWALISHQTWFHLTNYALNALKIPDQIHHCAYTEPV